MDGLEEVPGDAEIVEEKMLMSLMMGRRETVRQSSRGNALYARASSVLPFWGSMYYVLLHVVCTVVNSKDTNHQCTLTYYGT